MFIRITEAAGASDLGLDFRHEIVRGTLSIGGAPPCDVVIPALGTPKPVAELRVGPRGTELVRLGELPVEVAGRDLGIDTPMRLGAEVLVRLGELELVFSQSRKVPPGMPDSASHPSAAARDLLKQVYAALGVPEEHPGLVVHDAEGRVLKQIELGPNEHEVTIGRGKDNRLVLYHGAVSKHHARVVRDGLGYFVEDLGSKNGTEVGGEPVRGRRRLRSGESIKVGPFLVRFVDPKQAIEEMASSVPDLRRIEKAAPGERVQVGDEGVESAETLDQTITRDTASAEQIAATQEASRAGWLFWTLVALAVGLLGVIGYLVAINL